MAKLTKRQKAAVDVIDREKFYGLEEAVDIIKTHAKSKFDETVEIAMNLGVDPRHADQMVRGVIQLPNGTGKSVRVAVFARGDKADEALGPRGLMPNPKLGTVTPNVGEAVAAAKGGQVEFRAEKTGIIHAGLGKSSFTKEALSENIKAFVEAVAKSKPSGAKGTFIKKIAVSSTMGPGVKLEIGDVI